MRITRKTVVGVAAALLLGAGITTSQVAFADCDWHLAGQCSVSPSAHYWATWDVEPYGAAVEIGSVHVEFDWTHAPENTTTVVKPLGK